MGEWLKPPVRKTGSYKTPWFESKCYHQNKKVVSRRSLWRVSSDNGYELELSEQARDGCEGRTLGS